jgi:hypothetical protein
MNLFALQEHLLGFDLNLIELERFRLKKMLTMNSVIEMGT